MSKKEAIWRFLLNEALTNKNYQFTQKNLSEKFGFSLSTINNALRVPRQTGAVIVTGRNFNIVDKEKFLYLWATFRSLSRDIIYTTHAEGDVKTIAGEMPAGVIFTAFSGYDLLFGNAPADYDKVYIYADAATLSVVKERFPARGGYKNLIVLKSDAWLKKLSGRGTAPAVQLFVDLWNVGDWQAKDFLAALKTKLEI